MTSKKTSGNAFPFPTSENHGKPPPQPSTPVQEEPSEDALDSGVEESFPASDPVSVTVTKVKLPKAPQDDKAKSDAEGNAGNNR